MAAIELPYDPDAPPDHLELAADDEDIEIQYQVDCQRQLTVRQRIEAMEQLSAEYKALRAQHHSCVLPHVVERV